MKRPVFMLVVLASIGFLPRPAASQTAVPPATAAAYPQLDKVTFEDFSWLGRSLTKEPAYKSQKVRYCIWVLGNSRKSVMTVAWDESEGTGSGYDTLYVDRNFNGDLTEEGEKFFWENSKRAARKNGPFENYVVTGVKEADGERVFSFRFRDVYKDDEFQYDSEYKVAYPGGNYTVGPLPGDLLIKWSNDLKTAPAYRLGGLAVPTCNDKLPGQPLGTWQAGRPATAGTVVAYWGDRPEAQLRFFGSVFPGLPEAVRANRWGTAAYPFLLLRVLKPDGAVAEDIPLADSCPCSGGFSPELTVPYRVRPGRHQVIARMLRLDALGGPADYVWPVEIANPDFGQPMKDPAFEALKAKYNGPQVKFAFLRRADEPKETVAAFPDEKVLPARAYDAYLDPSNRDWDPSPVNFGTERFFAVGLKPWYHAPTRALVKVDLAGFPKETKILGAQLRLALMDGAFKPGSGVKAYAVRRDWNEAPHPDGQACWKGPKFGGKQNVQWTKPGCDDESADRFGEPTATAAIGEFPARLDPASAAKDAPREANRLLALDVSELARKWHSLQVANNGLLLVVEGEGNGSFAASEFVDYPYRPTLAVAYEGPDPKPTFIIPPEEDLDAALAEAKKNNQPLLMKFYSAGCLVCRRFQATTLADERVKRRLARQYRQVSLKLANHAELASKLGVAQTPALVVTAPDGATVKGVLTGQVLFDAQAFLEELDKLDPAPR